MLRRYLKPVYVFTQKETESDYVGTKTEWVISHTIHANVQCAANKLTSEIYGERVSNMLSLICDESAEINEGNRVSFTCSGKPTHKIVSVMRYSTHKTVLAEVIV